MKIQRMLSNGSWNEVKLERVTMFINLAVEVEQWLAPIQKREPRTAQGILDALAAGEIIKTGTDWYNRLRDTAARKPRPVRQPDYPNGRKLSCGCTVYNAVEVMNASMGSSCANCYDRMSD